MVGHSDPSQAGSKKSSKPDEAAQRAINAKVYLVTDKSIDPSRISVYTGAAVSKAVESFLIPSGATLNQTELAPVDETIPVIPRNAYDKHRKGKKKH